MKDRLRTEDEPAEETDDSGRYSNEKAFICKYFNTPRGCKYGKCKFAHEKVDLTGQDVPRQWRIAPHPVCRYFSRPGGCLQGDNCGFIHQMLELKKMPRPLCKDLKKPGGCAYGDSCKFAHEILDKTRPALSDVAPRCKYFTMPRGCIHSDKCRFVHEKLDHQIKNDAQTPAQTENTIHVQGKLQIMPDLVPL